MRTPASDTELVVLIGPDGRPAGTHPKATVHTTNTPLHYAFSCYLTRPDGQVLLTRRALAKPTWPGVWTNSMCGHPGPGETPEAALRRRASQELGISPAALDDARLILPDFSYRATDSSGIVEWEVCPVFMAVVAGEIAPNPEEVDSWQWLPGADVLRAVEATPFAFSPWMREQLNHAALREALLA